MAVFPWDHSRTRTNSGDKKSNPAVEWFSRSGSGAEPSRHALTELMKQHSRTLSGDSNSSKTRSRSTTGASQHSQYCSATTSECSGGLASRPTSPTQSIVSAIERPSSSARSLFSRGGGLRRISSKMSLNSDTASTSGVISPPRFNASRLGFRRKESLSPSKTPVISQPFGFQHVVHTEQTQFNELTRVEESDLASRFGTLQATQRAGHALRGIQAEELGVVTPPKPSPSTTPQLRQSPLLNSSSDLPSTPPRPSPPPKDLSSRLLKSSSELRTSRSIENFSRPAPRSPSLTSGAQTARPHTRHSHALLPPLNESPSLSDDESSKPLPQLPSVIHAVSTDDDTARCLIAAPLPTLPPQRPQHKRQTSSKSSLRHMSTFPSPRNHRTHGSLQDGQLTGIQEEYDSLPRHRSDDALSTYLHSATLSRRVSHTSPPVDDWDDAIDYAWDHAEDEAPVMYQAPDHASDAAYQIVQQSGSLPHTPSMGSPALPKRKSSKRASRSSNGSVYEHDNALNTEGSRLSGLGIDSRDGSPLLLRTSRPPTIGLSIPEDGLFDLPSATRSTYSTLSKSSSQESIIMSVASSMIGTQRSSNSSVNPSDLVSLEKWDDSTLHSFPTTPGSGQHLAEPQKAARPESTCVPAALLKGFSPRAVEHESNPMHDDDDDDDDDSDEDSDHLESLPPFKKHGRAISAAVSSITDSQFSPHGNNARAGRQRSSTMGSRRPPRGSYTLFPNASAAFTPAMKP